MGGNVALILHRSLALLDGNTVYGGRPAFITIHVELDQAAALTSAPASAIPKSTALSNFWGRLITAEAALTPYFSIRNNNQKRLLLFLNF